jgi:choline dehydrogenase-like flavoprotein
MIRDAGDVPEGAVLRADLCVVGAGAAGIALALQFLHDGRSVLLLESGGLVDEVASQALYDGDVADPALHAPPIKYRQRRFGGSTGIWGGRCVPFDPIDFERRSWIPDSGWPFGIETLLPYYPAANQLCEAGAFAYTAAAAFAQGMRPMLPHFRGRSFTDDTLERFSCPTDFGRRYRHRLAQSRNVAALRQQPRGHADHRARGAQPRRTQPSGRGAGRRAGHRRPRGATPVARLPRSPRRGHRQCP